MYNVKYGLQDVILGQTLAFQVMSGQDFVQVLNTGKGHWVTISTIGCQRNEVDIFDSLYPTLSSQLQMQISVLLCTKEKSITVRFVLRTIYLHFN